MKENVFADISQDEEIKVYHYGMEQCDRGHFFGPAVRDHFLIHFILDGKGIFKSRGIKYNLHQNQAFLITPNEVTYYEADMEEPWVYCWVGFYGTRAGEILNNAGLTLNEPILTYDDSCRIPALMEQILDMENDKAGGELKLKGLLYLVLSEIQRVNSNMAHHADNKSYRQNYIEKAVDFISSNYSRQVKVSDIARHVGLDRSYFSYIFRESLNMSPQEYLIKFRMKKASELLRGTTFSIGDIARSVGYNDPLCFSKAFRRFLQVSPSDYRAGGKAD